MSADAKSPLTTPHRPLTISARGRRTCPPAPPMPLASAPPNSRTTCSSDRSAASTASTRPWMSSLASTTLSLLTFSSTLSSRKSSASLSLAATTDAGSAPSPGSAPVYLPLENTAAHYPRRRTPAPPSASPPPARYRPAVAWLPRPRSSRGS
eukprot:1683731-Pleurochrysis_carterae.AAC.1